MCRLVCAASEWLVFVLALPQRRVDDDPVLATFRNIRNNGAFSGNETGPPLTGPHYRVLGNACPVPVIRWSRGGSQGEAAA